MCFYRITGRAKSTLLRVMMQERSSYVLILFLTQRFCKPVSEPQGQARPGGGRTEGEPGRRGDGRETGRIAGIGNLS